MFHGFLESLFLSGFCNQMGWLLLMSFISIVISDGKKNTNKQNSKWIKLNRHEKGLYTYIKVYIDSYIEC